MEPRLSTKLSRRDFLKLTAQFVGLTLAKKIIPPVIIDSGLDMSLSITADGMGSPIPQEFASIPIPEKNNDYRAPENIIIDALDLYEVWRKKDNLPRVHFKKGEEYLDATSLAKKFPRMFEGKKYGELNGLIWRLKGLIMPRNNDESVNNADIPEILRFSEISQNGIADYIFHNPGSKILIEAQEYICKKYSWTRKQLMSSIIKLDTRLPEVKSEDWDVATKIVSFRLKDAIHYFEERREIVGAPLSTSEIIAYFLYQNKGDLKQSMWDSTLLLKVLARNDIDTLVSSNTFDKAEQLGYLFKDEFSPQISHNWLTEKFKQGLIPKESQLYLAGDGDNQSGKNFMPINKAGTYYHVMNLFTWAATCMDPWVVKSILAAYYNGQKIGGFDVRNEHGADKVLADTKAAQASDNIQRVVNWRV